MCPPQTEVVCLEQQASTSAAQFNAGGTHVCSICACLKLSPAAAAAVTVCCVCCVHAAD